MRSLITLFKEASSMRLNDSATSLIDELLQRNLDLEGPPPEPIEGISLDYRRTFIRTLPTPTRPNGTPIGMCATWLTDTWRCLLLEIPSCAMARPQYITPNYRNRSANSLASDNQKFMRPMIAILDSKSKRFQANIIAACRCLGLNETYSEVAVMCIFGTQRTFLAWRERQIGETFNAILRGDTDNYTKNCLDGLQKAQIISNDRGVFRVIASKTLPTEWLLSPPSISNELEKAAIDLHKNGITYKEIKTSLILSHKKLALIFENYSNKQIRNNTITNQSSTSHKKKYTDVEMETAIILAKQYGLRASNKQTKIPINQIKTVLMKTFGTFQKRKGGRPSKIIPNHIIYRIRELAQNGNSISSIHKILLKDLNAAGLEKISIRKIRSTLLFNK